MTASLSRVQIVARARADKSQPNLQICQTDRDKMARAWAGPSSTEAPF